MVYFFLLIPVAISGYVWQYVAPRFWGTNSDRNALAAVVAPLVIGLLLVVGGKGLIEKCQTTDTEWWTGWATKVTYDESWTERCTITTTDSKGNTTTTTYYVYHPADYYLHDNNGCCVHVGHAEYLRLKKLFGNSHFEALFHLNQSSWGDGNRHYSTWPGSDATFTPVTTTHWYENRVIASHSVFKFPPVEDVTKLYAYAPVYNGYHCSSVLWKGHDHPVGDAELTRLNARLGHEKQVRIWLLVFEDQPLAVAYDQESLWQGGNKNELVINVGLSGGKISWAYCFSWTERDDCKLELRDCVMQRETLDIPQLVKDIEPIVREKFVRKSFHDFDYLTVDPPAWALITLLLVMLVSGFLYVLALEGNCR